MRESGRSVVQGVSRLVLIAVSLAVTAAPGRAVDQEEEAPARRPVQTPSPPYPYVEEEVRYPGAGVTLAGTLTIPEGEGPHPAAILLTVAGPNDRDQTMPGGHKPFMVLADHLTRRGIAVLRSDDRGVGDSEGDVMAATIPDLADDAVAAARYLAGRPEIDGTRIGVIGNSEGGMVGPLAASRSDGVAWVVMLAGPGVRGAEVVRARIRALATRRGMPPGRALAPFDTLRAIVLDEPDRRRAELRLRAFLESGAARMPGYGFLPRDPDARVAFFLGPWYRSQLTADPAEVLPRVDVPVLALTGSKDVTNLAEQNLPAIARLLAEGGNPDYTVAELPGLNHYMQPARRGGVREVAELELSFSPLALATISDWILRRFGPESARAER